MLDVLPVAARTDCKRAGFERKLEREERSGRDGMIGLAAATGCGSATGGADQFVVEGAEGGSDEGAE